MTLQLNTMDSKTSFSDSSGTYEEMKLFPCEEKLKSDPYADKQLPPVDGGIHAWLFLAACAMIEALVWGSSPLLLSLLLNQDQS